MYDERFIWLRIMYKNFIIQIFIILLQTYLHPNLFFIPIFNG